MFSYSPEDFVLEALLSKWKTYFLIGYGKDFVGKLVLSLKKFFGQPTKYIMLIKLNMSSLLLHPKFLLSCFSSL